MHSNVPLVAFDELTLAPVFVPEVFFAGARDAVAAGRPAASQEG